jgi:release factor glutamine methyltransferase
MTAAPPPLTESDVTYALRAAGSVFAEDEARLLVEGAESPDHLAAMVARRVEGNPLELILGWTAFCGLRIESDPGVFVPRQRTEFLVARALDLMPERALVVDLCCGTGAIGAALAHSRPDIELYASDIMPASFACATRNLSGLGTVYLGDLFAALPSSLSGRVDIIVVNAPYVPSEAIGMMPPEARDFEPLAALDGGDDGLDFHRRVAAEASEWLAPCGSLLIETSVPQSPLTAALFSRAGLAARIEHSGELDATIVVASA